MSEEDKKDDAKDQINLKVKDQVRLLSTAWTSTIYLHHHSCGFEISFHC